MTPSRWQSGGGGEGGGAPSKLEKEGKFSLPTHDITRRLPDSGGGEGRRRRGREDGGSSEALVAASAWRDWWAAARWLRRAFARAPRRRCRRTGAEEVDGDSVGGAGVVAVTSLTLVLPPTVETDRVACPPAFSILWKTSIRRVSSSPIFDSESESIQKCGSTETDVLSLSWSLFNLCSSTRDTSVKSTKHL